MNARLIIKEPTVLTIRENQCAYYLMNGMTAKEIGKELELSPRTIESYIDNIKRKLLCKNKAQLIVTLTKINFCF